MASQGSQNTFGAATRAGLALILFAGAGFGQSQAFLNEANLRGSYFFRHLQFSTDTSSNLTDSRAVSGTIVFDAVGRYSGFGTQIVNSFAAVSVTLGGTYSVGPAGTMTLSSPQRPGFLMNGRAGAEAILASTTESGDNTFDLFVAVPAPATLQSVGSISGTYFFASLELPGGSGTALRSSLMAAALSGNGAFNGIVTGHAANVNSGAVNTGVLSGLSYSVAQDGSGTFNFGSANTNLNGLKNIVVSQSGNVIIGGSPLAGSQDLLIGVRAYSGTPAAGSISGLYWGGGLRLDRAHKSTQAYAGSVNGIAALGRVVFADRLHQIGISPGYDFTGENDVTVNTAGTFPNGTLSLGFNIVGLGANGAAFVEEDLSNFDSSGYSIDFAIQAPALAGSGVYIQPQGVVNAASLAPAGQSISPGEFVTIFGSGLAAEQAAASPPYPAVLSGVSVAVNGTAAPVYFVNAGQVNFIVPYGVTGSAASVVVTNNGVASNTVTVPLQKTSPGVFSVDGSGTGDGMVTHASGALVNARNPAKKGETVTVYAGGLGTVTPQPADGAAGGSATLSQLNTAVAVTIGGQATTIPFAGLAPGFPGLYQINVTIPAALSGSGSLPLAVQTIDTFTDQVNIAVQ